MFPRMKRWISHKSYSNWFYIFPFYFYRYISIFIFISTPLYNTLLYSHPSSSSFSRFISIAIATPSSHLHLHLHLLIFISIPCEPPQVIIALELFWSSYLMRNHIRDIFVMIKNGRNMWWWMMDRNTKYSISTN